jgi:protein tyrosine phosphatase (PTP) superfamily phosphohydrolase (DUF442 family)
MKRDCVVAVLFLLALTGCSGGTSRSTAEAPPAPEPVAVAGVPNAVRVGDLLFGGQPTEDALRMLKGEGYRTVLSTRGEGEAAWDEKALVDSLGMAFAAIPMGYPIEAITDAEVDRFDDLMQHGERPMVLHCSSGNRVAGLWAVWLVERRGMDRAQALELGTKAGMTRIRPVVEKRLGKGS